MTIVTVKQLTALTTEPESGPLKMPYEEFLAWLDEDIQAEWVPIDDLGNGEVIIQMPPKLIHQETVDFLSRLLGFFIHLFDLGKIIIAPFEMKLGPGKSSREPDILFVTKENLNRLTDDRLNGPADLIIEVISKDSLKRDRDDKFKEYRQAGVREYWIIDPRSGRCRADFYVLDGTGEYKLMATEEDERVESQVLPGFWLDPAWLWQADTLDPFRVLGEIAGLPERTIDQIQAQLQAGFKKPEEEPKND